MVRTISFYEDYFIDFYNKQSLQVQEKIDYCLIILSEQRVVPTSIVRHITNSDGIYEIKVRVGNNQYRILFFFEEGDLISGGEIVILINSFVKKNDKDLKKAVIKAEKLKAEYYKK